MKTFYLLFLSLFIYQLGYSQEISLDEWNKPEYASCNSAADLEYLNPVEKETIKLMNCARMNGKLFARTYLLRYIQGYNVKKSNYLSTLLEALETSIPSKPFIPSLGLHKAAKDHANDLGSNGATGHTGTDGSKMGGRIETYVNWGDIIGENCSYGPKTALEIVCVLLVDEGVVTFGHRKNILSKEYQYVGVATAPHTLYKIVSVTDFAGKVINEK